MARGKKTRTVADVDAEMARLQRERDALIAAEVKDVIGRIKEAIRHYGLSAEDLGLASGPRGKGGALKMPRRRQEVSKRPAGAVKYADDQGHTWTGRGKRPQWFLAAIAAGKKPEELLVDRATA